MSNCSTDGDCPGGLICFVEVAWSEDSYFCDCHPLYGKVGPTCEDFSTTSYLFVTFQSLFMLVVFYMLLITGNDLVRTLWTNRRNFRENFSIVPRTQCFISISFGFFFASCVFITLNIMTAPPSTLDGLGNKLAGRFGYYLRVCVTFSFGFAILAASHISIVWLSLVKSQFSTHTLILARYNKLVYVFSFVIICALLGVVLAGELPWATVVVGPAYFILTVLYIYGGLRFTAVLRNARDNASGGPQLATSLPPQDGADSLESARKPSFAFRASVNLKKLAKPLSSSPSSPGLFPSQRPRGQSESAERTALEKLDRTLQVIKKCCFHVVAALILSQICLTLLFFMFGENADTRGTADARRNYGKPGQATWLHFASLVIAVPQLYLQTTLALYCHRSTKKTLSKHTSKLSVNSSNPSANHTSSAS